MMRGYRLGSLLLVVVLVTVSGCTRQHGTDAGTQPAAAAHRAPPPANPDFSAVIERFYQQVEGAHWRFAYAMLSPRCQTKISPAQFERRYADFAQLSVAARQTSDRTVTALLDGGERNGRARHFEEKIVLVWDGEQWTIDAITRHERPAGTR